jgi:hypothetical protein
MILISLCQGLHSSLLHLVELLNTNTVSVCSVCAELCVAKVPGQVHAGLLGLLLTTSIHYHMYACDEPHRYHSVSTDLMLISCYLHSVELSRTLSCRLLWVDAMSPACRVAVYTESTVVSGVLFLVRCIQMGAKVCHSSSDVICVGNWVRSTQYEQLLAVMGAAFGSMCMLCIHVG